MKVDGNFVTVLALSSHSAILHNETRQRVEQLLKQRFPQLAKVTITLAGHETPVEKIGQIGSPAKSVVAVGCGKGGVGKSTIAATLALGWPRRQPGRTHGCRRLWPEHSAPARRQPATPKSPTGRIQPIEVAGLKVMSMGFLVPPGEAVVWRGPMLHGAITQFLRDTAWGELDYLIIDMPPGTGDIALTLSQLLPLSGAVVVCTPQDVALLDAVKAVAMFRKVNIPILGMVENMSGFLCPDCGKRYDIFGSGGAKQRASDLASASWAKCR